MTHATELFQVFARQHLRGIRARAVLDEVAGCDQIGAQLCDRDGHLGQLALERGRGVRDGVRHRGRLSFKLLKRLFPPSRLRLHQRVPLRLTRRQRELRPHEIPVPIPVPDEPLGIPSVFRSLRVHSLGDVPAALLQ